MRNTLTPLDGRSGRRGRWAPQRPPRAVLGRIVLTAARRGLAIGDPSESETDDFRAVPGRSPFVLEMNAGFAGAHRIVPGTGVRIEHGLDLLPPENSSDTVEIGHQDGR